MAVTTLPQRTVIERREVALFPYEQRTITIDSNVINYVDEGQGPPLVLLHPLPASSFIYRSFIPILRRHFRCIAFDAAGFGFSRAAPHFVQEPRAHAELVRSLLTELDLQGAILYLHDTLGAAGLWAAVQEKDRLQGLIIGTTFAWSLENYPEVQRFISMLGRRIPGDIILQIMMPFYFNNARYGLKGTWAPAEKQAYKDRFGPTQRRNMQLLFRNVLKDVDFYKNLSERLTELSHLPVFLPWGTEDQVFGLDWLERFETLFPNHRTLVIDGAHHFPQEHAPQLIIDGILDWWAEQKAK